jgi:hypothetical protein
VSAAGASVTLAKKSESYFDQYLDEIVYFFESRPKVDVVVFEDLDRFNEAGIFEALRELNTLLNNSKQITARPFWRHSKRTIRFVYALRDSIFEQLGRDTKKLENDAAQAESVRANRTKFFDLVIPIVPFITHRTARELLARVLDDGGLTAVPPVSDDLVDLAARHLPDMRLLINIRNEYSIFAKRLVDGPDGMDTLTPNQLFAMVVYKNLHLEDFELMQLGRSNLDTVYRLSRELVSANLGSSRAKLRRITDGIALKQTLVQQSTTWGERLEWFGTKGAEAATQGRVLSYVIDGTAYEATDIKTPEFWEAAFDTGTGVGIIVHSRSYGHRNHINLGMDELQAILGDRFRPSDWNGDAKDRLQQEQERVLADLEVLRRADFKQLTRRPDFRLKRDGVELTFRELIAEEVPSELGRTLIADGYIDRYYNLYTAQYYGERVPANAMSFIIQNVDTNRMDVNYEFNNDTEIASLLKETRRSFLGDISAYNIYLVDYLLRTNDSGVQQILDNVIRHVGESERAFIDAYLAEGTHAHLAVGYLAGEWTDIFAELVEGGDLPHDRRVQLVDAALAGADAGVNYRMTDSVTAFVQENFQAFATVVDPAGGAELAVEPELEDPFPTEEAVANAVGALGQARFRCPDLSSLREPVRKLVVEGGYYTLSAANLRAAVQVDGPLSLDNIRHRDQSVYREVLSRPEEYLKALSEAASGASSQAGQSGSQPDSWTVSDPDALVDVLNDMDALGSTLVASIAAQANPEAVVVNLNDVPTRTWEALAECRRFPATLNNVDVYTEYLGEIDSELAAILMDVESIIVTEAEGNTAKGDPGDGTEPDDGLAAAKNRVSEYVLNASKVLPNAEKRAALAGSLDLAGTLPVAKVPAERGPLLGAIIAHEVCADSEATFAHFGTTDWETLREALKISANFVEFVTPALLPPAMARRLLTSPDISNALKEAVLRRFDEFVPSDDAATLAAAAHAAMSMCLYLGASRITAISHGTADGELATRLVHHFRESMTTEEALDAVLQAGGPYGRLSTTGEKLIFPRNEHHEAVLQRFKAAGYISSRAFAKSMLKEARIEVEVL